MMIYFLFKPLHIQQQIFKDIPQFNMSEFTIYELNRKSLETLITGVQALKYKDKYVFREVNFTDNSQKFFSNIQAKRGVYKNNIVKLQGDVFFIREDGLRFQSQSLIYNTKSAIAYTNDNYIAFFGENSMRGSSLKYDSKKSTILSKNIIMQYQIEER